MPSLMQLWAPILLAALLVQVTSTLIHMVLKWHNSDYRKLANEDQVRAAIRAGNPAPGQYVLPHCLDPNEMKKPDVAQKWVEGPVAMLYVIKNGAPSIGPQIGSWAAFSQAFFEVLVRRPAIPTNSEHDHVWREGTR